MHLVSLGCPKNLVDSEVMLGILLAGGYTLLEDPAAADLLLINTCGFIKPAVEEAIDEILRLAEHKSNANEQGRKVILAVTGCLVQRYGRELQAALPEVDLMIGTDGFQEIERLLAELARQKKTCFELRPAHYLMDAKTPRKVSTPPHRAYLKLTEGCDNRCSYCLIPSIRGSLRSRVPADILAEAARLEAQNLKELTLIAQDTSAYGRDLDSGVNLAALLRELLEKSKIPWIRLLYLYPTGITDELLHLLAASPRILNYLDIPLQHVSDGVLRRMNRHYNRQIIDDMLSRIRTVLPDAALRTTLMVGFPGETEEDVDLLAEFLRKEQLDHVGIFQYQNEEGCAAWNLSEQCTDEIKQMRYDRLMKIQAEISLHRQQQYIGKIEEVLVEGLSEETELLLEGRTAFQAPDIDGRVYINAGTADQGSLVHARINEAHPYDLIGEIL